MDTGDPCGGWCPLLPVTIDAGCAWGGWGWATRLYELVILVYVLIDVVVFDKKGCCC